MALFLIPGKSELVEPEEEETWVTLKEKVVTQYGSWQRVDRTAGRRGPELTSPGSCRSAGCWSQGHSPRSPGQRQGCVGSGSPGG